MHTVYKHLKCLSQVKFLLILLLGFTFFNVKSASGQAFSCSDIFINQSFTRYDFNKPPHEKSPIFSNPPNLALTNYSLVDGTFNSATVSLRTFNGLSFEIVQNYMNAYKNVFRDHTMLGDQQDFSLKKMVETGYITSQEAEYFRRLGGNLDPNQVFFWEVYHQATRQEIEQFYPDLRFRSVQTNFSFELDTGLTPVKSAAMWNVAGQVWDLKNKHRPIQLPWEHEEARRDYALNRSRYKYVFEWGRAAQDVSGDIAHIYAANTLLSLLQVIAMGGRAEDAYVMVHSFDKVNTRLYSRMHPNTLYPAGWKNLEDALFLVPLTDALKKYDIAKASEQIRRVVEISQGQLSPVQAVESVLRNMLAKRNEFHYRDSIGEQASPIVVIDNSSYVSYTTYNAFRALGLRPNIANNLNMYLTPRPPQFAFNYLGKYDNAADSKLSHFTYREKNGIEISNLDPAIAARNPDYVIGLLFSVLHQKILELATLLNVLESMTPQEAYMEAANILNKEDVHLGITSHSPIVLQQVIALQPAETYLLPATDTSRVLDTESYRVMKPYFFRDAQMSFFSVDQIANWALANPAKFSQLRVQLSTGAWTSQYMMSFPDVF